MQDQSNIPAAEVLANPPKYLVFDTETTGLFQFKDKETGVPIPADDPRQPRMASFAGIITDAEGYEISRTKYFVKPDGWSIDGTYAAQVNGLSDEKLHDEGVPVVEVLDFWEGQIKTGMIAAAFNAQFDCKMMRAELRRAGREDMFENTPNTCLMRALAAYKDQGLEVNRGMVKLEKACAFFGIENLDPHDAMGDAAASVPILQRLVADGNLIPPKVHYSKAPA